ncbi:MAG TPA: hypothetical protein VMW56_28070, partial [Candidatus Margulisiibacteriota bacterium]|nr:hypothetical protein [Candidatus Margulisiibacteriota bacterium]
MESAAIDRALHRAAGYAAARSKGEDHMGDDHPLLRDDPLALEKIKECLGVLRGEERQEFLFLFLLGLWLNYPQRHRPFTNLGKQVRLPEKFPT